MFFLDRVLDRVVDFGALLLGVVVLLVVLLGVVLLVVLLGLVEVEFVLV